MQLLQCLTEMLWPILIVSLDPLAGLSHLKGWQLPYQVTSVPLTGGMENCCLTFVTPTLLAGDRSLANVVAHEIAHSW